MFLKRQMAAVARAFRYVTRIGLPDLRPVFIAIPKTGSTSVARMLRKAYWGQPNLYLPMDREGRERVLRMPDKTFSRFGVYRGSFDVGLARERVPNPFILTFLRDPLELTISAIYYGAMKNRLQVTLEDYIPEDCNMMTRMLVGGPDAEAAIEALSSMDFVGITERIDSDMPRLLRRLGKPNIPVERKNLNSARPAVDDLPAEIRSLVMERTQADRRIYQWALERG